MKAQELKIIFKQDKAYLTTDKPITLEQVDLPDFVRGKIFKSPAYWTIKVIDYSESEKKIFCEILSYQIGETEFEYNQKQLSSKLNEIEFITFRGIDTSGLLKTLSGSGSVFPSQNITPNKSDNYNTECFVKQPYKQTLTEDFFIPLKDVRFILGGVSFHKKLQGFDKSIEFTIENYDIREEFDAIKNYFANVLKTKKIQVTATIELSDYNVTSIVAKSPEIDKINRDLIDNVKFEFVRATKKKISVSIDKNLFTMDEYFDNFADEKFKSNTFFNNEKDFFEDLLKISNTKHYKQLRFLSSKHSHEIMKLRFIHKPFSFIFLIQGDRNYHIIWETLDTEEATYVWHIAKDKNVLKLTLQKLENIINVIKVQGKTAYINTADEPFRRIYHDYSEFVDGFLKWKGELENYLT